MKRSSRRVVAAGLLATAATAGCRATARESIPAGVRPHTEVEAASLAPAGEVRADSARRGYVEADVRFMQGMMAHHAQALAMTSLVPSRSDREDIRLLARRIEVSQQDEIALVRHWLEDRREEVPSLDTHHEHHQGGDHQALMPGMLTAEELARLATVTGAEFGRLFLTFMIRHHEGALTMVANLFATHGAGQEAEVFRFASDVDADQRAEIRRMRTLQDSPPPTGAHHR